MEACTGIPMYDGQPVEVGPRARLVTYKNYDEKGTSGQNVARQMEYHGLPVRDDGLPRCTQHQRKGCCGLHP